MYTDGACSGNPGPGGWGCVLIYKEHQKQISGREENTTNNQMELTAAIEGLRALKEPCKVKLYSDSQYLCKAFNDGWIDGWLLSNFKNNTIKNEELWRELIKLCDVHKVDFIWVKGHADNKYNNLADKLARDCI